MAFIRKRRVVLALKISFTCIVICLLLDFLIKRYFNYYIYDCSVSYSANVKVDNLAKQPDLPMQQMTQQMLEKLRDSVESSNLPTCRAADTIDGWNVNGLALSLSGVRLLSANWEKLLATLPSADLGQVPVRSCVISRQRVAVMVAIRNRTFHLRQLLLGLHKILRKRRINYRIFVIEQLGDFSFNRAALFNFGFQQVQKISQKFDCFILHDVDLLPVNMASATYECNLTSPVQLVRSINGSVMYAGYFGGVTAFTREQYLRVNGFSNLYFGWGGEDDDLFTRVELANMNVHKFAANGEFVMLGHKSDAGNAINTNRMYLLSKAGAHQRVDGLNSLQLSAASIQNAKLFILMQVEIRSELLHKLLRHVNITC